MSSRVSRESAAVLPAFVGEGDQEVKESDLSNASSVQAIAVRSIPVQQAPQNVAARNVRTDVLVPIGVVACAAGYWILQRSLPKIISVVSDNFPQVVVGGAIIVISGVRLHRFIKTERGNIYYKNAQYYLLRNMLQDAVPHLEKAAKLGHDAARRRLVRHYITINDDHELVRVKEWLIKMAEEKDKEAQIKLGFLYLRGFSTPDLYLHGLSISDQGHSITQNVPKAIELLSPHLDYDDGEIAYQLYSFYRTRGDLQTADKYLKRSASRYYTPAKHDLAKKYLDENTNFDEAISLLTHAAKKNYPDAKETLFNYACRYRDSPGDDKNEDRALLIFVKLIEMNHLPAMDALYRIACRKRDEKKAASEDLGVAWALFMLLARKKHALSIAAGYDIACRYRDGRGVDKDLLEAHGIFALLVEADHVQSLDAIYDIACRYQHGRDVDANLNMAIFILRYLVTKNHREAIDNFYGIACRIRDGKKAGFDGKRFLEIMEHWNQKNHVYTFTPWGMEQIFPEWKLDLNVEDSLGMFRLLAEKNHVPSLDAIFDWACRIRNGKGVNQDIALAKEMFIYLAGKYDSIQHREKLLTIDAILKEI